MIERIGDRASFARFARARRQRCGPIGLRYVARPAEVIGGVAVGGVRVAYAINRKVGSAVVRNRIRRRLREALAELDRGPSPLERGDYLFSAERPAADLPFDELKAALRCVTRRAAGRG
ncbi:MAG: ribonuclease P protein component [Acidimicrobiia bacterium]